MSNSDIECPQCGTVVYYELDRCPECGFDFYPPDDETEEGSEPPRAKGWATSLGAIMVGWLVSGMTTFILFSVGSPLLNQTGDWQLWSLTLITGSAFIGGYVTSAMVRRLPAVHGILVAVLSLANTILLETLWRPIAIETLIRPMTYLAWGLVLVGGLAGAEAAAQLRQRSASDQPQASHESDLYDYLLIKVRHDPGVADRLIALERQRAPTASRKDLIQNAIARWERDNR